MAVNTPIKFPNLLKWMNNSLSVRLLYKKQRKKPAVLSSMRAFLSSCESISHRCVSAFNFRQSTWPRGPSFDQGRWQSQVVLLYFLSFLYLPIVCNFTCSVSIQIFISCHHVSSCRWFHHIEPQIPITSFPHLPQSIHSIISLVGSVIFPSILIFDRLPRVLRDLLQIYGKVCRALTQVFAPPPLLAII